MKRSFLRRTALWLAILACSGISSLSAQSALSQPVPCKEEGALRIMCYNIRNCRGMDEVIDYRRVADVIDHVAPDLLAVQEVDSVTGRNGGVFVLRELADRTGMQLTYGSAIDFQGGKYGVGILSREKPVSVRAVPLPGSEEPRVLLIAEFADRVLACTHFSLTAVDRETSARIVAEELKGYDKPVFLAGDMNCTYDTPPQSILRESFTALNDPAVNTIPVRNPNRCIDYIYHRDEGRTCRVVRRMVLDEQMASDHLPLFVDVVIE